MKCELRQITLSARRRASSNVQYMSIEHIHCTVGKVCRRVVLGAGRQ